MTDIRVSEWDGTPWAGETKTERSLVIGHAPLEIKAVTGAGVAAYQNDVPLYRVNDSPQARAARYLQAYKVGWFYKAEHKISSDMANLALTVAPEDDEGDNQDAVIEPDLFTPIEQLDPVGKFLRLMERPNPQQTGRALRQKTFIRVDMAGWAYWYLEPGPDGLPQAIYGIGPQRMWPSFAKDGTLIGWVMDADQKGKAVPFQVNEILAFANATSDESDMYGLGVVEAIQSELPLSDLMARHVTDLLATGGRLAGMMWPKTRGLDEDEFVDAQRAWRNVSSDPNAARRLLLFPEPMEWAAGASTPMDIGIPALAELNRENILTAFPISPYQLGVPTPGGLNSAELKRQDRRDYWESTIHPRVEAFEETIQIGLLSRYEAIVGSTLDFEIAEPNLDDAGALIEKAAAMKVLQSLGFDDQSIIEAAGLDHIKWIGRPAPEIVTAPPVDTSGLTTALTGIERGRGPAVGEQLLPAKSMKAVQALESRDRVLDPATKKARADLEAFFGRQKGRVTEGWRKLPARKSDRSAMKDSSDWWDPTTEDADLMDTMTGIYTAVGRGGLQTVADTLDRIVGKGMIRPIIADLLKYGGTRIADINAKTLQALTIMLAEGTRRGYSIDQLIDGVPDEGFGGIAGVTLDNGVAAFDPTRAETIARTETMLSYNRATVTGYAEFGVTELEAFDGDQDEECAARLDANPWSVEDAAGEEDHPNGTLVWSPIVDDQTP